MFLTHEYIDYNPCVFSLIISVLPGMALASQAIHSTSLGLPLKLSLWEKLKQLLEEMFSRNSFLKERVVSP